MISNFFLNTIYYLIYIILAPIRAFDDVVINSNITGAIGTAGDYLNAIDSVVPINTIIAVFGIFLVIETAVFVYKIVMWIIKKIPTIN